MARSTTITTDFLKFDALGNSGGLIVKLMICCNDMSLANQSLAKWKDTQHLNSDEKFRSQGAGMYFVRLQLSHMYEGLSIIEQISKDQVLMAIVGGLDEQSKKSFEKLTGHLGKKSKIKKHIEVLRHKVTFHYDESTKLINRSIKRLASKESTRFSSVSRGDHAFRWYFQMADRVVNYLSVRLLWKIPDSNDSNVLVDGLVAEAHDLFVTFMDFSGEFIWKCAQR